MLGWQTKNWSFKFNNPHGEERQMAADGAGFMKSYVGICKKENKMWWVRHLQAPAGLTMKLSLWVEFKDRLVVIYIRLVIR